ncbi:MAG: T9SS type A sorting domain-containing protein, partial [Bacteroidia bacterium]
QTFAPGDLVTAPYIGYYVTGNSTVAVAELESKGVALSQNMPNPANGSTKIGYELTKADNVVIEVRDITGKQVMVINNGKQAAGRYSVEMDLNKLDAGVYFYSLITDNAQITKKMNVIK